MSINLRKAPVSGLKRCCLFNKSWKRKKVVWRRISSPSRPAQFSFLKRQRIISFITTWGWPRQSLVEAPSFLKRILCWCWGREKKSDDMTAKQERTCSRILLLTWTPASMLVKTRIFSRFLSSRWWHQSDPFTVCLKLLSLPPCGESKEVSINFWCNLNFSVCCDCFQHRINDCVYILVTPQGHALCLIISEIQVQLIGHAKIRMHLDTLTKSMWYTESEEDPYFLVETRGSRKDREKGFKKRNSVDDKNTSDFCERMECMLATVNTCCCGWESRISCNARDSAMTFSLALSNWAFWLWISCRNDDTSCSCCRIDSTCRQSLEPLFFSVQTVSAITCKPWRKSEIDRQRT